MACKYPSNYMPPWPLNYIVLILLWNSQICDVSNNCAFKYSNAHQWPSRVIMYVVLLISSPCSTLQASSFEQWALCTLQRQDVKTMRVGRGVGSGLWFNKAASQTAHSLRILEVEKAGLLQSSTPLVPITSQPVWRFMEWGSPSNQQYWDAIITNHNY